MRGIEVQSVGIASISYDEESQKLIQMRNQGAMLSDAAIREKDMCRGRYHGFEAAGSNANGSAAGFVGIGMGMQSGSGMASAFSQSNQQQMSRQPAVSDGWKCSCGAQNGENDRFCSQCGAKNRRIGNVPNAMPNVRAISAPNAENPSLRQKRNVPNAAI